VIGAGRSLLSNVRLDFVLGAAVDRDNAEFLKDSDLADRGFTRRCIQKLFIVFLICF
jgi:hypothetical protein